MQAAVQAGRLARASDSAQGLVDVVVVGINCQVSYFVLEQCEPEMVRVEGVPCLGKGRAHVCAAFAMSKQNSFQVLGDCRCSCSICG